MINKGLLVLFCLSLFLGAAPAMAQMWPTEPATFGADGGSALQARFDAITTDPLGNSSIDVTTDSIRDTHDSVWNVDGTGTAISTVFMEAAGFAGSNTFGIYDPLNISNRVQIFSGADSVGSVKAITMLASGQVLVNFVPVGAPLTAANSFGFYLDASEGNENSDAIFHSDTVHNADGLDHMYAYQGLSVNPDEIQIPTFAAGDWTDNMFALAFEDLWGGGDMDYTDFVVMVESVTPVPVPGAVMLGIFGLGAVGLRLRKSA